MCSRCILYLPCPTPGISHFSEKPWFLLILETKIWSLLPACFVSWLLGPQSYEKHMHICYVHIHQHIYIFTHTYTFKKSSSHWYLLFIFISFFLVSAHSLFVCSFLSENLGTQHQHIYSFAQSSNTSKIMSELLFTYRYIKQTSLNKFRICLHHPRLKVHC